MAFKTFTSGAVLTAAEINTYLMQQSVIVCTAATRPSAPVEGMRIAETDTDLEYIYSGTAWVAMSQWGAWTTYVPTLTQSGTVTKTDTYARYTRQGRMVTVQVKLTVTGTGTASNAINVTLPVTAASSGLVVGGGAVTDASAGFFYKGLTNLFNTTSVQLWWVGDDTGVASLGVVGMTAALASSDEVIFEATYEAAA